MNVALVTCSEMPEPDADEVLLQDAVRARGLVADVVPWDAAPAPPPEAYTLWVLRSPWNYHHHLDAFLAFAARVAARRTLLNPLHIVRWNARKTYLRDLKQRGVPVVPTAFVPRGGGDEALSAIARTCGWDDVVVKPVVSGGSFGTRRFRAPEFDDGQAFLHDLTATREVMVQGYVPDVEGRGERAVVFIDGMLTHAVRKSRRLAGDDEAVSEALAIADDERALAELALRPYRDRLLYGRVDMVRDAHGVPMVMELELLEPSLFLAQHPPALQRLADAIVRAAADAAR
ncbi:hypothetical protein L6V77_18390 [Myxococcota bacterium]|nr:hypothetical protein [Myxococcota bacterium]